MVGSVTVSDLAACWDVSARAAQAWWSAPARIGRGQLHVVDVCTTETLVGADESLIVALLRMDDAGADHLIVVEGDGRPAGMISRRDVIAAALAHGIRYPGSNPVLAAEA